MKYSGWDYLDHMLQTCKELEICLADIDSFEQFENSVVVRRAVVMCLLDLGELITGLSEKETDLFPSDSWHRIVGFRNRAAHGYHTMDFEIVYTLATQRIPPLHKFLREYKCRLSEDDKDDVLPYR